MGTMGKTANSTITNTTSTMVPLPMPMTSLMMTITTTSAIAAEVRETDKALKEIPEKIGI